MDNVKSKIKTKIIIPESKVKDDFGIIEKIKQENGLNNIKLSRPIYNCPDNSSVEEYFDKLCLEGLKSRYGDNIHKNIMERYEKEKSVIFKLGLADIFLHYKDVINWAKNNNAKLGIYRGSAIGSLICYILELTNIDPIKYNLIFERFINSKRLFNCPVIEFDVETGKKDELIEYIIDKYGCENTALGNELSFPLVNLNNKKEYLPLKTLIYVTKNPIKSSIPLGKLDRETYISMENIDIFEKSKCLKFAIHPSDVLEEFKEIDIDDILIRKNIDFNLILNNFSEPGIKILKQLKPKNIEELTAIISLDRQGPIESGMVEKYIKARNLNKIEYYNDSVEQILKDTYGEIIYQEQIIQILNALGDFDLEEAEIIRRSMAQRKVLTEQEKIFIEKATDRGFKYVKAKELWDEMESCSINCFIKAHAISASLLLCCSKSKS